MLAVLAAASLWIACAQSAFPAEVLDHVRSTGVVTCGVITEEADYTKDDTHGSLASLSTDVCKAVAAAVLASTARSRSHPFRMNSTACVP